MIEAIIACLSGAPLTSLPDQVVSILVFMLMKAGLIVAVFMHMRWERLALMYAILTAALFACVDKPHGDRSGSVSDGWVRD